MFPASLSRITTTRNKKLRDKTIRVTVFGTDIVRSMALKFGLMVAFSAVVSSAVVWSSSPVLAQTPPATPVAEAHWYVVPTPANGCQLNLRSGPSTGYSIIGHLNNCTTGTWCWYQVSSCGRTTVDEVIGGRYTCFEGHQRAASSNRWTVVALTSTKWAYVASRCGWALHL